MATLTGSDRGYFYKGIIEDTGALRPISEVTGIKAKVYSTADDSVLCELEFPSVVGKEPITQVGTELSYFKAIIPYTLTKDADLTSYVIESEFIIEGLRYKDSNILTNFLKSRIND